MPTERKPIVGGCGEEGDVEKLAQLKRLKSELYLDSETAGQPGCLARHHAAENLAAVEWALSALGHGGAG